MSAYENLFNSLTELLFRYNPMRNITPRDSREFFPEALAIMPRLLDCKSAEDASLAAYEAFVSEFKATYASGRGSPLSSFSTIGLKLWEYWEALAPEEKEEASDEIRFRNKPRQ